MSANIEVRNGRESFAHVGEPPWWGLGNPVDPDSTPKEMQIAADLDWEVEKRDLTYETVDGKRAIAPKKKALVRTDDGKLLDIVGDDWHPLNNAQAFEFFEDFVRHGDMQMHTAGSLDNGRRVWALAKVNDAFEVFKSDVVEQYLLLSNPHVYGKCIDVRMTPIRVVCQNTLSLALGSEAKRGVRVNHRNPFDEEEVKAMLGVAAEKLAIYKEAARFLGKKKYTKTTLVEYFDNVFPLNTDKEYKEKQISRRAKMAIETVNTQPGAAYGKGTWWQAFNTVTYMTDHVLGRNNDTRMQSAWFGYNQKVKNSALELATKMAEAA